MGVGVLSPAFNAVIDPEPSIWRTSDPNTMTKGPLYTGTWVFAVFEPSVCVAGKQPIPTVFGAYLSRDPIRHQKKTVCVAHSARMASDADSEAVGIMELVKRLGESRSFYRKRAEEAEAELEAFREGEGPRRRGMGTGRVVVRHLRHAWFLLR